MNVQPSPDAFVTLRRPERRRRGPLRYLLPAAVFLAFAASAAVMRYGIAHPVESAVLSTAPLAVEVRAPGNLDAIREVTVSTSLAGRLSTVAVDLNDRVTSGEIVARLDDSGPAADVASAEATATAADRAIDTALADLDRARASLANARANHDRQLPLAARGAVSQANADSAVATLQEAEADLTRSAKAIDQARAQAASAHASVKAARAKLDDTVMRAPFDGIVVARSRNPGDVVTAGASVLTLVDPSSIVFSARFDESILGTLRVGMPASLGFSSDPGHVIAGHVLRLDREVDEETREVGADIVLDALPENWALGQRGTARITLTARDDVLSVPKAFIARHNDETGLWIEKNGRARWQAVRFGPGNAERAEIQSGVASGETVLAPKGLFPFMRITTTAESGKS
ncbi:Multidrug resistance protein MdtN [Hartmannibacter diazotrophicus]|uniref:Multidrug resistance protein MdtN n=1 Tax=Hartmannibacter diazotrophicus TaxID=1482074 RepID=A0A2C9DB62_9HYPH|nr:efflux RND transporter periplasmic adaptor subunit [Hartmannibacter diazotrophicus]SON57483.1 Multidrug resistance protein MdtN [Hartmannibacter diazotrophicus]